MTENRIKDLREARDLTAQQLAKLAGTTQAQISRLENGERRLTVEWLMRLAKALECAPEDLLAAITLASFEQEATPYPLPDGDAGKALADQKQALYKPNSDALENLGFEPNDPILFDQSTEACATPRTGDITLVQLTSRRDADDQAIVVRQYIDPHLFSTNRRGRNTSFHAEEDNFTAVIIGIHRASPRTN